MYLNLEKLSIYHEGGFPEIVDERFSKYGVPAG